MVVRRAGDGEAFKLAVPLKSTESFDPVSDAVGLHAHYSSNGVEGVINVSATDATPDAVAGTQNRVTTSANCRFGWVPGWYCDGVYDTETICTIIGGINAVLLGDNATGIGFVDDILVPLTGVAGAACGAEQFAELLITDWLGGCSTNNWVYELYRSKWWNPAPAVVASKCG